MPAASETGSGEALAPAGRFDTVREIGTHQAHTILGTRIHDMYSSDRYATALLSNILGGPGMNSLLNVALRERRGLVYTVEASTALMTDTGLFTIYYGCDTGDVERCRRLVSDIISRQASDTMSQRQLDDARRQYIGQLTLASTNSEQRALNMARSTLLRGECHPLGRTPGAHTLTHARRPARSRLTSHHTLAPYARLSERMPGCRIIAP